MLYFLLSLISAIFTQCSMTTHFSSETLRTDYGRWKQTLFTRILPEFVQPWQSAIGCVSCCDWWCWYVSLRGNSSCSYLCFILTEPPESVLENKGGRVLCGVHLGQVQFTVNTLAGVSQRSHISVCMWVWRKCFHRVKLQLAVRMKRKLKRKFRRIWIMGCFWCCMAVWLVCFEFWYLKSQLIKVFDYNKDINVLGILNTLSDIFQIILISSTEIKW